MIGFGPALGVQYVGAYIGGKRYRVDRELFMVSALGRVPDGDHYCYLALGRHESSICCELDILSAEIIIPLVFEHHIDPLAFSCEIILLTSVTLPDQPFFKIFIHVCQQQGVKVENYKLQNALFTLY